MRILYESHDVKENIVYPRLVVRIGGSISLERVKTDWSVKRHVCMLINYLIPMVLKCIQLLEQVSW